LSNITETASGDLRSLARGIGQVDIKAIEDRLEALATNIERPKKLTEEGRDELGWVGGGRRSGEEEGGHMQSGDV